MCCGIQAQWFRQLGKIVGELGNEGVTKDTLAHGKILKKQLTIRLKLKHRAPGKEKTVCALGLEGVTKTTHFFSQLRLSVPEVPVDCHRFKKKSAVGRA